MSVKIFIDGQEGTTGLKILERFENRTDIEMLKIPDEYRKNRDVRKEFIHDSDFTFLCLPDDAAREAVKLAEGSNTRIIDASTAHRTLDSWAYGFPELSMAHRKKIENSSRVAVPGCYPTGFLAAVYPLIKEGVIPEDYPIVIHANSGYSGGGKSMIAQYKKTPREDKLGSPWQYALNQTHKHQKEMKIIAGLEYTPIFNPQVGDFYSGMTVSVPLYTRLLNKKLTVNQLKEVLKNYYNDAKLVNVCDYNKNVIFAQEISGKNYLEILVFADEDNDRVLLMSRLDNLGKGASGAAVQCLNIMLGIDETTGLV